MLTLTPGPVGAGSTEIQAQPTGAGERGPLSLAPRPSIDLTSTYRPHHWTSGGDPGPPSGDDPRRAEATQAAPWAKREHRPPPKMSEIMGAESPTEATHDVLAKINRHFEKFWQWLERRLLQPAPPHSDDLTRQNPRPNSWAGAWHQDTRSPPRKAQKPRLPPGHPRTRRRQISNRQKHRGSPPAATQSPSWKPWCTLQHPGPNQLVEGTLLQPGGYSERNPARNHLSTGMAWIMRKSGKLQAMATDDLSPGTIPVGYRLTFSHHWTVPCPWRV
ncbi:Hypothetical predicted protein [Pelobates cultripes]|uniref:Uncharacterized protein n=1 Tax=Pelobates cultripes TaxID=61616 RepID=A0AAD1WD11_PELCU|nr:Hypothetical predicted protein [Pelobates cultripes]